MFTIMHIGKIDDLLPSGFNLHSYFLFSKFGDLNQCAVVIPISLTLPIQFRL